MNHAEQQVAAAFKAVNVAMRRMRGRQTHRPDGLSYAQCGLLFALDQGSALSARDLGEAASLSPASVAQMLDRLEANGLVARTRSEQDKRIVLTELTEQGRAAVAEMRERMDANWSDALSEFSDEELHSAAAVLNSLGKYFEQMGERPEAPPETSETVSVGRDDTA